MLYVKVAHERASQNLFCSYKEFRRAGLAPGWAYAAAYLAEEARGREMCAAKGEEPSPRGGHTFVRIYDGDCFVCSGIAECSLEDSFCYKTGTKTALKHAIVNGYIAPDLWIPLAQKYGKEYVGEVVLAQYEKKCRESFLPF